MRRHEVGQQFVFLLKEGLQNWCNRVCPSGLPALPHSCQAALLLLLIQLSKLRSVPVLQLGLNRTELWGVSSGHRDVQVQHNRQEVQTSGLHAGEHQWRMFFIRTTWHYKPDYTFGFNPSDDDSESDPLAPMITWKDFQRLMPWEIVILVGGGYALAAGCKVRIREELYFCSTFHTSPMSFKVLYTVKNRYPV